MSFTTTKNKDNKQKGLFKLWWGHIQPDKEHTHKYTIHQYDEGIRQNHSNYYYVNYIATAEQDDDKQYIAKNQTIILQLPTQLQEQIDQAIHYLRYKDQKQHQNFYIEFQRITQKKAIRGKVKVSDKKIQLTNIRELLQE